MKNSSKTRNARLIAIIILHLIAVVLTVYSVQSFFTVGGDGNMSVAGAVAFRYFTVDSNILAAISSLVAIFCAARELQGLANPPWIRIFRLLSVTSVALTFLTVMLFLGPFVYGYPLMFVGVSLFMHLITPLIEVISFVWLESVGAERMKKRYMIIGITPMLVYGAVYLVMVVFTGKWPDFYAFNTGGMFGLTVVIMTAFTSGISFALGLSANLVAKKTAGNKL